MQRQQQGERTVGTEKQNSCHAGPSRCSTVVHLQRGGLLTGAVESARQLRPLELETDPPVRSDMLLAVIGDANLEGCIAALKTV